MPQREALEPSSAAAAQPLNGGRHFFRTTPLTSRYGYRISIFCTVSLPLGRVKITLPERGAALGRRPTVTVRKLPLNRDEIAAPFQGSMTERFPVILSPAQLADLFGLSRKTIYEWIAHGRLDGAFRKRGKHVLFWRDRAIDIIFNDKEWTDG